MTAVPQDPGAATDRIVEKRTHRWNDAHVAAAKASREHPPERRAAYWSEVLDQRLCALLDAYEQTHRGGPS